MSRPDNQNNQIWQMTTKMPHGQLQTYRSQEMGDAVRMNGPENRGILAIWMTLQLVGAQQKDLGNQLHRLVPGNRNFVFDVWALITSFAIGDNHRDIFSPLDTVGNYALCLKDRPITRRSITHGIFPIVFHPDVLVQAVLHGDEIMVRHILKTNPDLTQVGEGMDFSGCAFTGTAIQAAIASGDFAPNQNSTGLCELLIEALKRKHPDDWHQIAHDQTLALYTYSLRFYAKKQSEKIEALTNQIAALEAQPQTGKKIEMIALRKTKNQLAREKERVEKRLAAYQAALNSNDLVTIIHAHTHPDSTKNRTSDAQKDHVIQVDQKLIDAIAAATDDEIQAVLDDPTIDSPLSNLIKQYRKEVDAICQSEIIANPQHLLKLFTLYDACFERAVNADLNCKKLELFWCHLVGYVQRYLPACDAQMFANPGLHDTVREARKNARSFDFEYSGSSIFPLLFDSHSGLGYKFARGFDGQRMSFGYVDWSVGAPNSLLFYIKLCRAKTASFQNLLHSLCEQVPTSLSVSTSDNGSQKLDH